MALLEQNIKLETAYSSMNSEGKEALSWLVEQLAEVHQNLQAMKTKKESFVPSHGLCRVNS